MLFCREDIVGGSVVYIDEPEYLRGPYVESINRFNWSQQFISQYQQDRLYSRYEGFCKKRPSNENLYVSSEYPVDFEAYVPKDVCEETDLH